MIILVADDHAILRKGLIGLLSKEYTKCKFVEASNGHDALSVLLNEQISLALLDIAMPKMTGIEVLNQKKSLSIKTPVIMVSAQPEDQYAIRVLKAGAAGFLNKNCSSDELIKAVNKVLSGKKYVSEAVGDMLAETVNIRKGDNQIELLSNREMQVLQLISNGRTVSEIADEIKLSVNTVSTYRSRILKKLSLKNNAALIRYALEHNLNAS